MKISRLMLAAALLFSVSANVSAASISASVESKIIIVTSEPPAQKTSSSYTGIIVDCRGLGLQRAMSPVIKNEQGVIIYGDKNLDESKITNFGMAHYATDMNDVLRAGDRPLFVRAIGVENFSRNPVLSLKDAEFVLLENNGANFLESASVVFLID